MRPVCITPAVHRNGGGTAAIVRRARRAPYGRGQATIVDTRKTLPGWRGLDKRAVVAGGGRNHRADLGSGVLIKDNHIAAAGGVRAAVERAQAAAPHGLRVEVLSGIEPTDDVILNFGSVTDGTPVAKGSQTSGDPQAGPK